MRSTGLLVGYAAWGPRDVIVLPERDFTALPTELGRAHHLHTALERAVELPVARPAAGEPVLVLEGSFGLVLAPAASQQ